MERDELIAGLRALGLRPEQAAVVALLPLVQVAWADGGVDMRERAVLEAVAEELGLPVTETDAQPLAGWLQVAPPHRVYREGRALLVALARGGAAGLSLPAHALDRLADRCRRVAEASADTPGLGGASGLELRVMTEIADGLARELAAAEAAAARARRGLPAVTAADATFDPGAAEASFDPDGATAVGAAALQADLDPGTWQPLDEDEDAPAAPDDPVAARSAAAALVLLADVVWASGKADPGALGWIQALAVEWGVEARQRLAWLGSPPDPAAVEQAAAQLRSEPLAADRLARLPAHLDGLLDLLSRPPLPVRARAEDLRGLLRQRTRR